MVTEFKYRVVVGSGNGSGWNWLPWPAKTGVSKATTGRQNRQNYNSKPSTLPRKADKGGVTGSFYFMLQLEDVAMGSWIEEL